MENKKTKLTISGSSKKPVKNFDSSRSQGKKTVIIGNQTKKNFSKGSFNKFAGSKSFNNKKDAQIKIKGSFSKKTSFISSDFEKRKLAEQRATKRLKGEIESKERKTKSETKKKRDQTDSF